jgi:hypothetical protein
MVLFAGCEKSMDGVISLTLSGAGVRVADSGVPIRRFAFCSLVSCAFALMEQNKSKNRPIADDNSFVIMLFFLIG